MLYPLVTLDDNTEIVHSEMYAESGVKKVKICIEKPVYSGFHAAQCILPGYEWKNIQGFSAAEVKNFQAIIAGLEATIIQRAKEEQINEIKKQLSAILDPMVKAMRKNEDSEGELRPIGKYMNVDAMDRDYGIDEEVAKMFRGLD